MQQAELGDGHRAAPLARSQRKSPPPRLASEGGLLLQTAYSAAKLLFQAGDEVSALALFKMKATVHSQQFDIESIRCGELAHA